MVGQAAIQLVPHGAAVYVSTRAPVMNMVMVASSSGRAGRSPKGGGWLRVLRAMPVSRWVSAATWYTVCLVCALPAMPVTLCVASLRYNLELHVTAMVVLAVLLTTFTALCSAAHSPTRIRAWAGMMVLVETFMGAGMALMYRLFYPHIGPTRALYIATGARISLIPLGFVMLPSTITVERLEGTFDYVWSLPAPRSARLSRPSRSTLSSPWQGRCLPLSSPDGATTHNSRWRRSSDRLVLFPQRWPAPSVMGWPSSLTNQWL